MQEDNWYIIYITCIPTRSMSACWILGLIKTPGLSGGQKALAV